MTASLNGQKVGNRPSFARHGVLATLLVLLAGCSSSSPGRYVLPSSEASTYPTAYIAEVVVDPPGDATGGPYAVIENNWEHREDLGGWWIEDADGDAIHLGIGRQIDPGAELRVYTGCGETTDHAVFACLERQPWDENGDVLRLLDAAGGEVARLEFGDDG